MLLMALRDSDLNRVFRFFFSLCLLASSFSLQAEELYGKVQLLLNRSDGVYQKGETVTVTALLEECGVAEPVFLQVSSYGKVLLEKEITLTCGETVVFSEVCEEPVSRIVRLSPAGDADTSISVGYLVAPEEFMPGFVTPPDLQAFWDDKLSRLRALAPEVSTFPAQGIKSEELDGIECYKFEINMPEGNPCRGYLAYPRDAAPGTLPIYLYVHSAGVAKSWHKDLASRVADLARKGYLAVDINAHGMLSDQPQEYYDDLDAGELKGYSGREFTCYSDYYFHNMFLRDLRGLDYATTLPVWDGKRILVHGESQGGGQALALAGIDRRVTHCVAIVPALTDMGGILDGRKCGWPQWTNKEIAHTSLGPSVLAYHDGATLVSLFRGDLYMEVGNIDLTCDPAAVCAGYNNARLTRSKELVFFPWRPHTSGAIDPRLKDQWKTEVESRREAFFNAYLQGPCFGEIRSDRLDDLIWENGFAGYRAFGPALQAAGEQAYGYDLFTKSVPYPVMKERFDKALGPEKISFHLDHGDGMDSYGVGPTLGGGTAALVDANGHIVYPWCWQEAEVVENSPRRFQVHLTYSPIVVNGREVVEHRLITLEAGSRLNRVDISYDGLDGPTPILMGIVVHQENPSAWYADDKVLSVADLGDRNVGQNGEIYCGVVFPDGFIRSGYEPLVKPEGAAIGHVLGHATYHPGQPFTYWFGSGWSKAGIDGLAAWTDILRNLL